MGEGNRNDESSEFADSFIMVIGNTFFKKDTVKLTLTSLGIARLWRGTKGSY